MSMSEYSVEQLFITINLNTKHFSKLKKYILSNQDAYCCFCSKKLKPENVTIEHIVPFSQLKHNQNHIDNLTLSCAKCNLERGLADFDEYRRYYLKKDSPPEGCRDFYRMKAAKKVDKKLINMVLNLLSQNYSISQISKIKNINENKVKNIIMVWL